MITIANPPPDARENVFCVSAEIVMIFGYFALSALLFGEGLAAAASIPGNLVQAGVGVVTAYIFSLMIDKVHIADLINQ